MSKSITFVFLFLISIDGFSQKFELKIDSLINLEIENLKSRGIIEIGYTKLACVNYGIRTTAYLFWNCKEQTFVQKFFGSEYINEFRKYQPIKIVDSVFFTFYENNVTLLSEKVKPFSNKVDTVIGDKTLSRTITTSHSCFRNFMLYLSNNTMYDQYFDFFDLNEFRGKPIDNSKLSMERVKELRQRGWEVDTTYKNSPERNLNYEFNSNLKIVEWNKVLTKFIDKVESENRFVEVEN